MSFVPPPTTPLKYQFTDHVVHCISKVDIALRVFPAKDVGTKRPWLIWVHGGGYIAGKHFNPFPSLLPAFHDTANYHIVTFSHRLLPQVAFQDMWDDISFQFQWCLCHLPSILGEDKVDITSYSIGGDSSGGHFATLAGFRLHPPPRVIISLYGVINPLDPFFEVEHPNEDITPDNGTPANVVMRMLGDREKSRAKIFAPWNWEMPPLLSPGDLEKVWGYEYEVTEEYRRRMDLNNYIHKKGIRMNLLFREENFFWKERYVEKVKKWSPLHLIDTQHTRSEDGMVYPPTVLLHGDQDRAVPVEQSRVFAEKLKSRGVEVEEIYPEGKGHTFDYVVTGPEDEGWKEYIEPLISFVQKHLK
ncbi:hypothetical protein I302_102749 [Kwoniella bestiolae CBS 10118]|uniref:Alpha/beta hydrolase fold-3 domain-containing protein n=1 Tax=Kwoniella bestiolae CBS 10118 TaxID=1296100 RepID=A0AAJ8K4N5_9TREE